MYDRLHTFIEVYRHRSMGKAAQALSLTQPAVSHQVAGLEREFGAPLFERTAGGVVPTAVADSLARDIAPFLDGLEGVVLGRLSRHQSLSGMVHLGAPTEFFSVHGGRVMAAFADTDLTFQVHLGGQDKLYQGLADGSIDIALLASLPAGRTYRAARIGGEVLRLYAHPALAEKARGRQITVDWLEGQAFVAYDRELSLIRQYVETVFKRPCTASPTIMAPDLRAIVAICQERPVWTVLPDYLIQGLDGIGKLVPLLPDSRVENDFNLVMQRSALRTPRIAFAWEVLEKLWMP